VPLSLPVNKIHIAQSKMVECLYEIFKVARNVYERNSKPRVKLIIDTDCGRKEIEELKEIVKKNQEELRRILKSKSSTEVTEVKRALRQANVDVGKYNIKVELDSIVITPTMVSEDMGVVRSSGFHHSNNLVE